jgi:hypothetical protein
MAVSDRLAKRITVEVGGARSGIEGARSEINCVCACLDCGDETFHVSRGSKKLGDIYLCHRSAVSVLLCAKLVHLTQESLVFVAVSDSLGAVIERAYKRSLDLRAIPCRGMYRTHASVYAVADLVKHRVAFVRADTEIDAVNVYYPFFFHSFFLRVKKIHKKYLKKIRK